MSACDQELESLITRYGAQTVETVAQYIQTRNLSGTLCKGVLSNINSHSSPSNLKEESAFAPVADILYRVYVTENSCKCEDCRNLYVKNERNIQDRTGGRPKQIDFSVVDSNNDSVFIGIETKFVKDYGKPKLVLKDLARLLELKSKMRFFMLAGYESSVNKLLNKMQGILSKHEEDVGKDKLVTINGKQSKVRLEHFTIDKHAVFIWSLHNVS